MKILLATPFMSEFDAGKYMIKALTELGHWVVPWDFRMSLAPPTKDCDLLIVNKGPVPMIPKIDFKGTSVLYYPDDISYPGNRRSLEEYAASYNYVFTQNYYKDYRHLPLGCDPDIHRKIDMITKKTREYYGADVAFIGTLRDKKRLDFIKAVRNALPDKYTFKIWGNGWDNRIKPVYFNEFALVCNTTKIIINQHYSEISPNRKSIEIPACGGALMIIPGHLKGVSDIYGNMHVMNFDCVNEPKIAANLAISWLETESWRSEQVKRMQKTAYNYTYKKQLEKMLNEIGIGGTHVD